MAVRWTVQHDPDSALEEIRKRFRDGKLDQDNGSFFSLVAQTWPEFAEAELRKLPKDSQLRDTLINVLWHKRLNEQQSPEEILAWFDGFDADTLPPLVIINLLPTRYEADPDAAFEYVEGIKDPADKPS